MGYRAITQLLSIVHFIERHPASNKVLLTTNETALDQQMTFLRGLTNNQVYGSGDISAESSTDLLSQIYKQAKTDGNADVANKARSLRTAMINLLNPALERGTLRVFRAKNRILANAGLLLYFFQLRERSRKRSSKLKGLRPNELEPHTTQVKRLAVNQTMLRNNIVNAQLLNYNNKIVNKNKLNLYQCVNIQFKYSAKSSGANTMNFYIVEADQRKLQSIHVAKLMMGALELEKIKIQTLHKLFGHHMYLTDKDKNLLDKKLLKAVEQKAKITGLAQLKAFIQTINVKNYLRGTNVKGLKFSGVQEEKLNAPIVEGKWKAVLHSMARLVNMNGYIDQMQEKLASLDLKSARDIAKLCRNEIRLINNFLKEMGESDDPLLQLGLKSYIGKLNELATQHGKLYQEKMYNPDFPHYTGWQEIARDPMLNMTRY